MRRTLFLLLITPFIMPASHAQEAYTKEIDQWHQQRIEDLKKPDGWINLAGLFWLKPGENRFGSNTGNDLVFEHPDMPAYAGSFWWIGNSIEWKSGPQVSICIPGEAPRINMILFNEGLHSTPSVDLSHFRMTIIKREDRIGVRFRDLQHPHLKEFDHIDRFPVDPTLRVTATLVPSVGKTIPITNVLGQTTAQASPGKLVFTLEGKKYSIDAIDEGGDELFLIFADGTSGVETYGAGRFMYVKKPEANGTTVIDFNKAFNPPCVFSDFATCPLPPPQNRLSIAIRAGEKSFHFPDHH